MRLNDPLFGRYKREIYVDRFTKEQSTNFLIKGFKELNLEPNINDIEDAITILDGITGWLTYYGYYRTIRKLPHKEAIDKVFEEGYKIVLNELERIINPSKKRYTAILKSIAHGNSTWSDIKAYVTVRTGHITDKRLTELLKNLQIRLHNKRKQHIQNTSPNNKIYHRKTIKQHSTSPNPSL